MLLLTCWWVFRIWAFQHLCVFDWSWDERWPRIPPMSKSNSSVLCNASFSEPFESSLHRRSKSITGLQFSVSTVLRFTYHLFYPPLALLCTQEHVTSCCNISLFSLFALISCLFSLAFLFVSPGVTQTRSLSCLSFHSFVFRHTQNCAAKQRREERKTQTWRSVAVHCNSFHSFCFAAQFEYL